MTRAARTHAAFLAVVGLGLALRVAAMLGYPSALWFGGDSGTYVEAALNLKPSLLRPSGFSVLLWLLRPFHSLTLVAAAQHLMGLATGVLVYLLVWRAVRVRARGLLGALAAAPVLLDGYQIQLEHLLMADETFTLLALAGLATVTWRDRPSWRAAAGCGLLLALAALTRSVGLPLLLLVLGWLVVRRAGWRPVAAAAVAFAVPMLGYVLWFHAEHKTYGLTRTDSIWLYGRTADFASCATMRPPPELRPLCPKPHPPGVAPANAAMWGADSGLRGYPHGIGGVEANKAAGEFAWLAIRSQPLDYLRVVLRDTVRAFGWGRTPYPSAATVAEYRFPGAAPVLIPKDAGYARRYGGPAQRVVEPYAGALRAYQDHVFLPGSVLGALLAAGLAGVLAGWWRWGGRALLPWLFSVALLVVPAATADFDYRYVLPAVPFACLAAALAAAGFLRPRPSGGVPSEGQDTVDDPGGGLPVLQ